jgi:hypothetical protein
MEKNKSAMNNNDFTIAFNEGKSRGKQIKQSLLTIFGPALPHLIAVKTVWPHVLYLVALGEMQKFTQDKADLGLLIEV